MKSLKECQDFLAETFKKDPSVPLSSWISDCDDSPEEIADSEECQKAVIASIINPDMWQECPKEDVINADNDEDEEDDDDDDFVAEGYEDVESIRCFVCNPEEFEAEITWELIEMKDGTLQLGDDLSD